MNKELVRQTKIVEEAEKYQKETNTFIDLEKQIKIEEREMEWELER